MAVNEKNPPSMDLGTGERRLDSVRGSFFAADGKFVLRYSEAVTSIK